MLAKRFSREVMKRGAKPALLSKSVKQLIRRRRLPHPAMQHAGVLVRLPVPVLCALNRCTIQTAVKTATDLSTVTAQSMADALLVLRSRTLVMGNSVVFVVRVFVGRTMGAVVPVTLFTTPPIIPRVV